MATCISVPGGCGTQLDAITPQEPVPADLTQTIGDPLARRLCQACHATLIQLFSAMRLEGSQIAIPLAERRRRFAETLNSCIIAASTGMANPTPAQLIVILQRAVAMAVIRHGADPGEG